MTAKTPLPDDWYEVAPSMTHSQLVRHYGLSSDVVRRMIRESGVRTKKRVYRRSHVPLRPGVEDRVVSPVEEAANYLRRFYRNVFRCDLVVRDDSRGKVLWGDQHKLPNRGRGFYHVDNLGVLANNDVIALAIKKGWTTYAQLDFRSEAIDPEQRLDCGVPPVRPAVDGGRPT